MYKEFYHHFQIKEMKSEREKALETKARLSKIIEDSEAFLNTLKKSRKSEYEEKLRDWDKQMSSERKLRLSERKKKRIEERRAKWYQEKEEALQRARDEQLKKGGVLFAVVHGHMSLLLKMAILS